jgi:hypothetical protein
MDSRDSVLSFTRGIGTRPSTENFIDIVTSQRAEQMMNGGSEGGAGAGAGWARHARGQRRGGLPAGVAAGRRVGAAKLVQPGGASSLCRLLRSSYGVT